MKVAPALHKKNVRRSLLYIALVDSKLHQTALRRGALGVDPTTHSHRVMVGGGGRVVVVVIGCCGCFCRWFTERVAYEYNAPRCSRTLCPKQLGHVLSHDL